MDENLLSKATFSEICKIMNHKDRNVQACIHSVAKLALMVFPGLMSEEFASIATLESGLSKIDVKKVAEETFALIQSTFRKQNTDFLSRADDAQIAHILITFSAYFDSIKIYLPNAYGEINLSEREKYYITQKGMDDYENYRKHLATQQLSDSGCKVANFDLSMPNPVEGLTRYESILMEFYTILNNHFQIFVEQLAFLEEMPEYQKEKFYAILKKIPGNAVENYKKQYYELSSIFPDFFIWTTKREHANIAKSIDVGFQTVTKQIDNISELYSNSLACKTLDRLHTHYDMYIKEPIVSTKEMPLTDQSIVLPAREDSFISQAFHSLIYHEGMKLEHTNQWIRRYEIGTFIADTLRSPNLGKKPLLILGDPGAGKTMLCHMLAARILNKEYHVIILHLRNLEADAEIYDQINQELRKSLKSTRCQWEDILVAKLSKPILLIFDGYDELLQACGKTYTNYLESIARFQREAMTIDKVTVRCIVTSRTVLIDKAQIPRGSAVIHLDEFDEKRIELWCNVWNMQNKNYYIAKGLDEFKVEKGSKAWDLAKQPLLLLMLALFDTNANALRKHKNLSATQLYNSLIRDFIEREQKKDDEFDKKSIEKRKEIVNREMERVSIAALGMYNRDVLYIHADQLQLDLSKLSDIGLSKELRDSEKLLGSFFFIHLSVAPEGKKEIPPMSYEFLHRTFGEFLVAHYIVVRTYELLDDIINYNRRKRDCSMSMANQSKWYISLGYTPLFRQYKVAEMIKLWAPLYFQEQHLSVEDARDALNILINLELPRVLKGEVLANLIPSVDVFRVENGYPEYDSMKHLAIYSNNLISMVVLLNECFRIDQVATEDNQAWAKLRHLWRYAFSEQDITDFTKCFRVSRQNDKHFLENKNIIWDAKEERNEWFCAFDAAVALDEKLEYTALGALFDFGYDDTVKGLEELKINMKAWVTLRNVLTQMKGISNNSIKSEYLLMIERLHNYCIAEEDPDSLLCYYLIMNYISDPNNGYQAEQQNLLNVVRLLDDFRSINKCSKFNRHGQFSLLRLLLLKLLLRIPLEIRECNMIIKSISEYGFLRNENNNADLYHLAALCLRIIEIYSSSCTEQNLPEIKKLLMTVTGYFRHSCRDIIHSVRDEYVMNRANYEILRIVKKALCIREKRYSHELLEEYLSALENDRFGTFYNIPVDHACLLLHILEEEGVDESFKRRRMSDILIFIFRKRNTLTDIFDCDPSAIACLCRTLILEDNKTGIYYLLNDFIELVRSRLYELPLGVYRLISELSNSVPDVRLNNALEGKIII